MPKNSATALVVSAVTGSATSVSKGNVIKPPPATALTVSPTTLATKKKKCLSTIHARTSQREILSRAHPWQPVQINIAAGKNNARSFSTHVDVVFHNRGIRDCGRWLNNNLHRLPNRAHGDNYGFLAHRHYVID